MTMLYRSISLKTRHIPKTFKTINGGNRRISHVCNAPPREQLPEIAALDPKLITHADFYKFSIEQPDKFWGTLAQSRLTWSKPFTKVQDHDLQNCRFKWFVGGELNVTVNCIDRHAADNPERIAIIWEKDEPNQHENITYGQLKDMVNRIANMLTAHGVRKSDRVTLYMPMSLHLAACILACARMGAIHNVVFAGFSPDSLAMRINNADSETIITADQAIRGGKLIPLKQTVDAARKNCPQVKRVFVAKRTGASVAIGANDFELDEEIKHQPTSFAPPEMSSEDPLFLLYTSGSTGNPKGLLHTQAGYLLYAMLSHQLIFDYKRGDVFGCMADLGWITGHTYGLYGPLANGGTTVLFESTPTYPNPGRYWETVERLKINQFYGSPTAYRLLHGYSSEYVTKYDLSSLRVIGTVGEPINHEAWDWLNRTVGANRCMIIDTWWQTETGGACISPCPADHNAIITPAAAMRPFYGIAPKILDGKGQEEKNLLESGTLYLTQPWPAMARTIWGDHERYAEIYFKQIPGMYFTGDGAHRGKDGFFQITGRVDDVLNISGHRLGVAEVEDIMDDHPSVSESAVVGVPHKIKGECVHAYVSLKDGVKKEDTVLVEELKKLVKSSIASYAVPENITVVKALPKTRSGKIMRRILKRVAVGDTKNLGDLSTLSDPSAVDELLKKIQSLNKT